MKYIIALLITSSAFAANLEITEYDQEKLAYFLQKLPSHIVEKSDDGREVRVVFPKDSDVVRMECVSEYFEPARVPSSSTCSIEIDINHQLIEKNYDEVRVPEMNKHEAKELYSIMTYGKEKKSFRSGEFEPGTDFNGRKTNIFSFLFECTEAGCLYRFSEKMIK
jgi:hypothetical protein